MVEKTETKKIDIHNTQAEYERAVERFKNFKISDVNKQLVSEYVSDCEIGWGLNARSIGKSRAMKYIQTLCWLTQVLESLEPGLTWPHLQMMHTKRILNEINRMNWGEWSIHDYKTTLRRFMTWLRSVKKYPADYPDSDKLNATIQIAKFPPEVNYEVSIPNKLKPISEIPTADEVGWLIDVWDEEIKYFAHRNRSDIIRIAKRNRALISILADTGVRIGGIGSLRIKDVIFDSLSATISVTDKTMRGEPVRLVFSTAALRDWIEAHPRKNKPEAPLWIDLETNEALSYDNLRSILEETRSLHNAHARERGLPEITKRLHFHAFRYYAQIRDVTEGMPLPIQCAQRGWSPKSDMPQHYARISTGQVDEWMKKHYGLQDLTEEDKADIEKIVKRHKPKNELPGYF